MDSDSNDRPASEAPSSSSSDFYTAAAAAAVNEQLTVPSPCDKQRPVIVPADQLEHAGENGHDDGDDDSSSEMDLSSPSRPSTPVPPPAATGHAGAKRKMSDATDIQEDSAKKRKVSATPAEVNGETRRIVKLSPELWQRVFLHLSPAMLSRCLRVCKDFNACLTVLSAPQNVSKLPKDKLHVMDSEAIWTHSRKTFMPLLPRPLARCSELAMLQLLGGRACQFCGRSPVPAPATSYFNAGPGPDGLRVIWPFRIRTCGRCLQSRMIKDVEVLSNPIYKDLRFGVSFGFCSQDLHFASDSVRTLPGGIPGNLRFSKIMYLPDLDDIKAEEDNAKALGEGAADEWRKGLFTHGKEVMSDSARWERWELPQRPGIDLAHVLREYDLSSFPRYLEEARSRFNGVNSAQPPIAANGTHPLPQPVHVFSNGYNTPLQAVQLQFPPVSFPQQHFHQPSHPRTPRNPQEVERARQARKADIERRCQALDPPLDPNVLQHIQSFQAALQITTAMTDAAWEILKPRILAQREAAELAEHERSSQLAALQAALPLAISDDLISKPAKETYDREYEQAQEPLQTRLGEYADDCINGSWGGGRMLVKDNAPIFAIQVLLHVRDRYHEDSRLGLLPKFDPPKRKDTSKQGTPPLDPFLSLDNMKWVYDNRVRTLTDVHRRENFICAGCPEEKKPKWFAFEGLIQHYGAKHTTAFSKGNIVVHWQTAEWPEEPPFHKDPGRWLKLDKHKGPKGGRPTPQINHEVPFPAPASASGHPEVLYYSPANGYPSLSPGYPAPQYISPMSQYNANGFFYGQATQPEPQVDVADETKRTTFASIAREIWDSLDGVQDLEACVRVQTAIHHASTRYQDRFHQKPSLDTLTDALAMDGPMRPLKCTFNLACKQCIANSPNASSPSYWVRIGDAKLYNMPSLITHFKIRHPPHRQAEYVDLMKEMMETPDNQQIKKLLRTVGMDDDKLALIAAAFPTAFPIPLPRIGLVTEAALDPADRVPSQLLGRLSKKPKNQVKKRSHKVGNDTADREDSQDPMPEPTEDEYDPRRPMFVQPTQQMFVQSTQQTADPSQYDTDARKPPALAYPVDAGLNLDSLAALHAAMNGTTQSAPIEDRRSRSPSVGRPVPPASRTSATTTVVTPTDPPDIAAILASLTGQATTVRTTTPPTSRRSGSAPRHPYMKQHYEPVANYHGENRGSSGHHDPYHPRLDSATSRGVQEIQTALEHNNRHFEHNQHHAPAGALYASAAQPAPPRYQYVYEGEPRHSHPPAQQAVQMDTALGQYVRVSQERELVPSVYQYERSAPRQIYVDQYGRPLELIPIDSAPAPTQYGPDSYGQLTYGRRQEQPIYTTVAPGGHYQPVYDDRRPMYYDQVSLGSNGVAQRFLYDNGRASVPRS